MIDRYRPLSPFAAAFASEYKGFMKAHGITNLQIAKKLDRNDGYVSERANGRRPLDTEDVDALAMLVDGWTGKSLMVELARRVREAQDIAPVTPLAERRPTAEDEIEIKQPPAKLRTAAKKGVRKADQAPTAD